MTDNHHHDGAVRPDGGEPVTCFTTIQITKRGYSSCALWASVTPLIEALIATELLGTPPFPGREGRKILRLYLRCFTTITGPYSDTRLARSSQTRSVFLGDTNLRDTTTA